MSCTENGFYIGRPIRCDLPEAHEDDHYDKNLHERWHWVDTKRRKKAYISGEWINPMTELEDWFCHLPNNGFGYNCDCGSGKPYIYWSREESWACQDCEHFYSVYMPSAVMWNIANKFGIPPEIMKPIYDQIEAQRPKSNNE